MRACFHVFALCVLFLNGVLVGFAEAPLPTAQAVSPNKLVHAWEYIYYPSLKYEGTNFLIFLVSPNQGRNLRLDIITHSVNPPAMLKKGNVSVHLHRANGEVLDIEEKYRGFFEHALGVSTGMSLDGGMDFSIMALFPWGTNALEESWFEVHIGQECYWVEVPCGFDQDPKNVSFQSVAGGPPTNAPAMKQLGSHDHVVHWEKVQYEVGNLPGSWNVSLNQSNPFYASSEVIL